jgi:hypothetical protein
VRKDLIKRGSTGAENIEQPIQHLGKRDSKLNRPDETGTGTKTNESLKRGKRRKNDLVLITRTTKTTGLVQTLF